MNVNIQYQLQYISPRRPRPPHLLILLLPLQMDTMKPSPLPTREHVASVPERTVGTSSDRPPYLSAPDLVYQNEQTKR